MSRREVFVPISFSYDEPRQLLLTRAEGKSFDEMQRHLEAEKNARLLGSPELFDMTGTSTTLTSDEVKLLVTRLKALARETVFGPTAFVTDRQVVFGMIRMLAILSELQDGPVIGVFSTAAEALDWLSHVDEL